MNDQTKTNQMATTGPALPQNLPAGARSFQAAVDGKLTQDVWGEILDAQIRKAKEGDRGAAKFLLEYAGGVASMRGATFVQQNHHHEHYHEAEPAAAKRAPMLTDEPISGVRTRTPEGYDLARERRAREAREMANEMAKA